MSRETDGKRILRRLKRIEKELEGIQRVTDKWDRDIVPSITEKQMHRIADHMLLIRDVLEDTSRKLGQ